MTDAQNEARTAAAMERLQQVVSNKLVRVLCPLYKESTHRPDPVGTGIQVRVADLILIATAAHVIEDLGSGPRYIGAGGEILPLPPLQFTSNLDPNTNRDADRLDLGCMVMDPPMASRIPSADTLLLSRLDTIPSADIPLTAQYLFSGFPASRQPRKLLDEEFKANSYSALASEWSDDGYSAAQLDRHRNIFLRYDKNDMYRDMQRVIGPDLPGVSGGAIWRIDGPNATPQEPLLSAVVISWRKTVNPLGLVGTRISEWIKLAAGTFPEAFAAAAHPRTT
jgi:hypothetical protein